jgi:D-amino-acid dehydrogenase
VPGYLIDPTAPLKFKPQLSWQQWKWCFQFLRACHQSQVERTTQALLKLSSLSRAGFDNWYQASNPDCGFQKNGKLVIYASQAAVQNAARQVALQAPHSPAQTICSTEECLELEPALAGYRNNFAGGVWTESECVADSYKTCLALEKDILKLGGKIECNTEVRELVTQRNQITQVITTKNSFTAEAIVLANAHAANALLKPLDLALPLYPLKGYSITLPKNVFAHAPSRSITDAKHKVVYAPVGEAILIAGMAELVGEDLSINPKRINELVEYADRLFGLKEIPRDVAPWAGLRPATPSSLPIIGKTRYKNLYLNLGHGALGFTLAFGSAKRIVDALSAA